MGHDNVLTQTALFFMEGWYQLWLLEKKLLCFMTKYLEKQTHPITVICVWC